MKGSTIVFDAVTVKQSASFAFDVWYANHYLPAAMASAPYLGVRRYGSPQRGTYVAMFETDAQADDPRLAAMPLPEHEMITSTERFTGRNNGERKAPGSPDSNIESAILYPVFFPVPPEREEELNAWYVEEHMPMLQECPDWPMCRRFRMMQPHAKGFTHVAFHHITNLRALESKERDRARSTPWRDRLAAEPWFRGEYRVYYRHATGS